MKTLRLLAGAVLLTTFVACGNTKSDAGPQTGRGGAGAMPGGAGGQGATNGRVPLVDWVDDLADNHNTATDQPDTVDDKVAIIIDTDDPAVFDPLLARQQPQP